MAVWTEIVREDVAVTHIGDCHVLVPLGSDVSIEDVRSVKTELAERRVWEHHVSELRSIRETIERNQRAREQVAGTEYDGVL